jgi:DNA-binding FadR family transcriptional regulator
LAEHMRKDEVRAVRIHQAIAQQLGTAILSGEYQPGDALNGEIEQSLALGVSRTPYREAIRILVAKGMLESRPKAGTHVTPKERWNFLDPDVLAWMFMGTPDPKFIRDLFELRGLIEPEAAALAAERRTNADVAAMQGALDTMGRSGLASDEGQAADRQFHHTMLAASGNDALASLSGSVGAAVQWTTRYKQRSSSLPRNPLPEHQAVLDAIVAGAPQRARRAMKVLLQFALDDTAPPIARTSDST